MNKFNIEPSEFFYAMEHFRNIGCGSIHFNDSDYNGRTININNRDLIHFANCSYLGLEKHPKLTEAAIRAVEMHGTQNSMSRAILSSPLYRDAEATLAKIFPGFQVICSSTTLASCSALPLLIKEKDAIILDAFVHNSVRMASQLCAANGTFVLVSKHNDMENVHYLVKRLKKEGYKNIWYCADGIYSMHGDLCDVAGLQKILNEEENFYAYVDDAHGIGWTGKFGSGYVIGHHGLHEKMIVVGSFAKSIASVGGVLIVPDRIVADCLRLTGQTSIFSGPIQPASLGALNASLELHLTNEVLLYQKELVELIYHFRNRCHELSVPSVNKDITPIQLIKIGETEDILRVQFKLIEKGFFPTVAAYPAVAKGQGGIRVSLTRHITKLDIDNFLECIAQILKSEKIKTPEMV